MIGSSILYKLAALSFYLLAERELRGTFWDPESEALQVSRGIFEAMDEEVRRDGGKFVLAVLPVNSGWWDGKYGADAVERWEEMISFVCGEGMHCIDLLDDLRWVPADRIDRSYDGWHFGPQANRLIAEFIWDNLVRMGVVRSPDRALSMPRRAPNKQISAEIHGEVGMILPADRQHTSSADGGQRSITGGSNRAD